MVAYLEEKRQVGAHKAKALVAVIQPLDGYELRTVFLSVLLIVPIMAWLLVTVCCLISRVQPTEALRLTSLGLFAMATTTDTTRGLLGQIGKLYCVHGRNVGRSVQVLPHDTVLLLG